MRNETAPHASQRGGETPLFPPFLFQIHTAISWLALLPFPPPSLFRLENRLYNFALRRAARKTSRPPPANRWFVHSFCCARWRWEQASTPEIGAGGQPSHLALGACPQQAALALPPPQSEWPATGRIRCAIDDACPTAERPLEASTWTGRREQGSSAAQARSRRGRQSSGRLGRLPAALAAIRSCGAGRLGQAGMPQVRLRRAPAGRRSPPPHSARA